MLADLLKQALCLEEMKRYPNKAFPVKKDVAQHSFEVAIIGISLAEWEQRKFGNQLDWEKLSKSLLMHDLAESVTGDVLPYLKNINRELFDKAEKELVDELLIPEFPKSWRGEYRKYILNPKSDSIEGKIVEASDRLASIEELTKMLNFVNPEKEIYHQIVEIIQEILMVLVEVDLESCRYFLKYTLVDWGIEGLYPEAFEEYLSSFNFNETHFENKLSIKDETRVFKRGDFYKVSGDLSNEDCNVSVYTTGLILEDSTSDSDKIFVCLQDVDGDSDVSIYIDSELIREKL